MNRARVIPILLLQNSGLYKTIKFKDPKYVGDPLNALKIFNEKQCDEIILLDINSSKQNKEINYNLIQEIATECFMPLSYGGGINKLNQIEKVLKLGVEKVIINSAFISSPDFLKEAVKEFATSTLVASVDVKKNIWGKYILHSHANKKIIFTDPIDYIKNLEENGVGEIMINNVDRDGTMSGYDIELIKKISNGIKIPLIAAGGCNDLNDIKNLYDNTNVSATAAGSFFVFHGKHRAVLISYPSPEEINLIKK
jgi:cyclase